jgi:hypothetical protein
MESGSGFPVQRFTVFWNPTTEEDGFLAAYLNLFFDKKKRYRQVSLMILFLFFLPQCAPGTRLNIPLTPAAGTTTLYPTRLPPAQQYAGEVLSYMIQVVTGQAGNPALRDSWRTCGVDSGLGLTDIVDILSNPAKDNSRLMIYDMNVRGLSQVLYRYDPRLNPFKGAYAIDGIYPSAELIALRLLLVDLIHAGRRVDLRELYRLMPVLMDQRLDLPAVETMKHDIVLSAATRLSAHDRPASTADGRGRGGREPPVPFVQDRIAFLDYDRWPLVVHSGNADRVIADLCPEADIVIIILGKNVDRSIHFDIARGVDQTPKRFYFDIMDITWGQIREEIAQVGEIVSARIQPER